MGGPGGAALGIFQRIGAAEAADVAAQLDTLPLL